MGEINWSLRDNDYERTSFTVPSVDLTTGNIDAEYAAAITLQGELEKVSLGNIIRRNHIAKSAPQGLDEAAADVNAQRETKAMLIYANTVTFERGRMEVPCVDLSKMMTGYPGQFYDKRYPASVNADWVTFVAALEAVLTAAAGGDAVEVVRAYHIGKAT